MTNGQTASEIHSELSLYHDKGLTADRIKEIDAHREAYEKELSEKIGEIALTRRFPQTAFVLAPLSFTPLFKDILTPVLKNELNLEEEILTLKPDVIGLNAQNFDEDETNILIASRFFHKLHGCGEIDGA